MREPGVVHPLGREHYAAFHVCAYNNGIRLLSLFVCAATYYTYVAKQWECSEPCSVCSNRIKPSG
jgi:hypothetical protein